MPVPVRVVLTPEEDRTLQELRVATHVPQRTCDCAHMVLLVGDVVVGTEVPPLKILTLQQSDSE